MNEGKNKKIIYIIIAVVLLVVIAVGIFLIVGNKGAKANKLKEEVITAENYEDVTNKLEEALGEADELYYYAYACMYYMMVDGFSEEAMSTQDESVMYKNIYNKTVQQLMDEGKTLMEENDVTVEQMKQQVDNLNQMDE